jgi:hypothetical protein
MKPRCLIHVYGFYEWLNRLKESPEFEVSKLPGQNNSQSDKLGLTTVTLSQVHPTSK